MQIATLIVFDYLQANFDRWNTANVPLDEHDDLVMRDNNRGWYLQNLRLLNRGGIDGMRRIPASLFAALERTTGEVLAARTLRASFRLLNRRQIAGYEARRRRLLAHFEEVIQRYGRERVVLDDSDAPVVRTALEGSTTTDAATVGTTPSSPTAEPAEARRASRRSHHRERRRSRHRHRSHHAP
jgi:hypothetical protein